MPQDDALLLVLMRFPQELVAPDQFELPGKKLSDYRISAREIEMAGQLIDSMTADWKPAAYRDDFRDKLHKFVERRIARASGSKRRDQDEPAPPPKGDSNVVDFMALLKKSLAAKGGRGGKSAPRAATRRKPRAPSRRAS
jgi:DNA end-binding protein Ku